MTAKETFNNLLSLTASFVCQIFKTSEKKDIEDIEFDIGVVVSFSFL